MNLKALSVMSVVFIGGYFLGAQTSDMFEGSNQSLTNQRSADNLKTKLEQSNKLNIQLKEKISKIEAKAKKKASPNDELEIDDDINSNPDFANQEEADTQDKKITLQTAYEAFEKGNLEDATKQFNALLASATVDSERSEIIDGLIAIHEATYQAIMQDGNYIHGAMWQLFEMQKLRPNAQVVDRAKALSNDILSRANEYLDANNLLSASDYLSSLVHTTNMMEYDVEGISKDELAEKIKEIETNPSFKKSLYQRASNNLMNGTPLEKDMAFWDFTKLAGLDSGNLTKDHSFQMQFADATLVHLTHLKEMNQPGEVKSRLDYIRYVFPSLMKDDRINSFF